MAPENTTDASSRAVSYKRSLHGCSGEAGDVTAPNQVVETYPYESLSHASLAWLKSNLALCDVVHVHEWGGVFVDVITASAYRQLKPGGQQHSHVCSMWLCW